MTTEGVGQSHRPLWAHVPVLDLQGSRSESETAAGLGMSQELPREQAKARDICGTGLSQLPQLEQALSSDLHRSSLRQ